MLRTKALDWGLTTERCLYTVAVDPISPGAARSGTLHAVACSHSGHTVGCSQQMQQMQQQQLFFFVARRLGTPMVIAHSSSFRIELSRLGRPLMAESD